MSLTLVVPSIGLDLSLPMRLATSIDVPLKNKCLIWNGPGNDWMKFQEKFPDWNVVVPHENLGCAGSWNRAAELYPNEPGWFLCNEDMVFQPGEFKRISAFCLEVAGEAAFVGLNDYSAFYAFYWTQIGRQKFGTFDENIWPAYHEDSDMQFRWKYLGDCVRRCVYRKDEQPFSHGKPKTGGMDYNAMLQAMGLFNRRYFVKKWGSLEKPINSPGITWKLDEVRRQRMKVIWQEFLNQPSPSIYT